MCQVLKANLDSFYLEEIYSSHKEDSKKNGKETTEILETAQHGKIVKTIINIKIISLKHMIKRNNQK